MLKRNNNLILRCWQWRMTAEILQEQWNNIVLQTATLTHHNENGSQRARHHTKGKDEEENCENEMYRCFMPSESWQAAWKEARQAVFKQSRAQHYGPVKADLVILPHKWVEIKVLQKGKVNWMVLHCSKKANPTRLFRLKGKMYMSVAILQVGYSWETRGKFRVQQCQCHSLLASVS